MKTLATPSLVCALIFITSSAWAAGNAIAGFVADAHGKPVVGAEVRAVRTDAEGQAVVTTTDSKGRYALDHLPLGTFKLTASVAKTAKSVTMIKTRANSAVRADFILTDPFGAKVRRDQSATDRFEGQDLRRMQQDQPFGH